MAMMGLVACTHAALVTKYKAYAEGMKAVIVETYQPTPSHQSKGVKLTSGYYL